MTELIDDQVGRFHKTMYFFPLFIQKGVHETYHSTQMSSENKS
jgi:hypothetical protein